MTTPQGYFESLYAAGADPWDFDARWYDRRKHDLTVAALPRSRYRSAFEPACSTGALTARLAPRCDRLLAVEGVASAVETATARVARHPQVTVRQAWLPQDWPDGRFDLVVLSELGYYFGDADLDRLLDRAVAALEPGGELVAVHWRWPVAEHARSGDDVHEKLAARPGLDRIAGHVEEDFRLDVFARVPPEARSVARREGLC